jgi:hypothetical protein
MPDAQNILKSPAFALQVLAVLSKHWENQKQGDKATLVTLLMSNPIMPTKLGMKKPTESFFPNVKVFDDLPVIQGTVGIKEKFLSLIGVRKTVDLETIFSRLLSPSAEPGKKKWSHVELIKYLASVREDIPPEDMAKLKASRICPAEASDSKEGTASLYKVSELFDPQDSLRALRLPIMQWPGALRPSSPEARFLTSLGLRLYPSAPELVDLMAGNDKDIRQAAMAYFITKYEVNKYAAFDLGSSYKNFVPLEGKDDTLVSPRSCYTSEDAAVLGFKILAKSLHPHAIVSDLTYSASDLSPY